MQESLAGPPFHYCEPVESGDWLIIGLDSCVAGEAGGEVSDRELARMDSEIAASQAPHVMICLHHPPVAMGSAWLDSVGMSNGDELLHRMAASGRVRLAVFGHVHQPYDDVHAGISIIGTPSTCRQFAQGSDVFAVDDNPPAYRQISLYTDGSFGHELVWVNNESV